MKFCKDGMKTLCLMAISIISLFCFNEVKAEANTKDDIKWEKHSKYNNHYIIEGIKYTYDINGEYARIVYAEPVDAMEELEILHIPEMLHGYQVVAIGTEGSRESEAYPFELFRDGLKEIVVPDAISQLYYGAFSDLPILEKITLPASLKELPDRILAECKNLKQIELPKGLISIGDTAFAGSGLNHIIIPENVKTIGKTAFSNCESLKKVQLSKKIKTLPQYAFAHCVSLKEINLENVTYFDDCAFIGCTKLKNITFHKNITYVGWNVFNETGWWNVQQSKSFIIINKKFLIKYNGKSKKPKIPYGVTHIVQDAFYNKQLTSIEIPDTVTFIGVYAFQSTGIKSIYFAGNAPKMQIGGGETLLSYLNKKCNIYYKKGSTGFGAKKWKALSPKTYKIYK